MIDESRIDRRTVLRGIGTVAVAGVLAGCGGDGSAGDGSDGSDGSDGDSGDGADGGGSDGGGSDGGDADGSGSDGGGSDGGDGGGGGVPSEVSEYLSDDASFDGVEDLTGQSEVTVKNGAAGNDGNFAFGPSAIRIDAGTTVVWEWTGKGGQHNVVDEDGGFEADLTAEEGYTFEQTFGESGVTLYYCQPHKMLGMKGAIIVE
jgi:halocyanin-like protein